MSCLFVCSGSWPHTGLAFGRDTYVPNLIRDACAAAACRHAYVAVVTKGSSSLRVASDGLPFYLLELTRAPDSFMQQLEDAHRIPQLLDGPRGGIFHCGIAWIPGESIPSTIEASAVPVHGEVRSSVNQLVTARATSILCVLRSRNSCVVA